jgi:hypothetical protein
MPNKTFLKQASNAPKCNVLDKTISDLALASAAAATSKQRDWSFFGRKARMQSYL